MARINISDLVYALQIAEATYGESKVMCVRHVTHDYTPCLDIEVEAGGERAIVSVELEKE
jgi:hypothetical protein